MQGMNEVRAPTAPSTPLAPPPRTQHRPSTTTSTYHGSTYQGSAYQGSTHQGCTDHGSITMAMATPLQVLAPIYYVFCQELEWARKESEAAGREVGGVS